VSLARGTGLRLAAYGIGGLFSLAALPLLIRHLGVEDFGRYVAVMSLIAIAALISDLGITGLALREYTGAPLGERHALMRALVGVRLGFSAAGAVVAIAFVLAADYTTSARWGAVVACAGLFAQVYADLVVVTLVTGSRFGRAAAVDLTRSATTSLLIVALVVADSGLVAFFGAYAAAAFAAAIVARGLAVEPVPLRPRLPEGRARRLLADSVAYAVATAVYIVYFRTAMLVVSVQSNPRQAGWFAAAFRLAEFTAAAAGIAATTATPTLVRALDAGRFRAESTRLLAAAAGAGAVLAGVVAAAAPIIVRILGGDELKGAAAVLRIEAIAIGLVFPAFALGAALLVLRRHRALIAANVSGLAAVLVCALLLVPDHGARGAAAATVIGECVLLAACAVARLRARPAANAVHG
jgi:O-antigen/teichoic acid export membrane protein